MVETKSLKVTPDEEQTYIDDMAVFGWVLKSSQEINVKESHLERSGDSINSVTTQENYVKLVFTRDTAMPNYARISQLEKEYDSLLSARPQGPLPINIILAGVGLLLYVVPGVLYIVFHIRNNKKRKAEYDAWNERFTTRKHEIFNEVRALVG